MSVRIEVAVYREHELIGRRSFEGGIVTVGSAPGCSLRFVGVEGVAHSHALVWDDGGVLTIVPSAGADIALNGVAAPIARPGPDDLVSVGPLDLRFERRDDDAVTASPLASLAGPDELDSETTSVHERSRRPDDSATLPGTPPPAGPGRHAAGGDEDEEEDDDEGFIEPFSLLDHVARSPGVTGGELTLQLVTTRAGRLTELATIDPGTQYMPALPQTLARVTSDGTAELSIGRDWSARARTRAGGAFVQRPAGAQLVRFALGGCAVLQRGDRTILAFFVRRPRLAPEIGRRGLARAAMRHGAAALAVHVAIGLVLFAFARPDAALSAPVERQPGVDDSHDLFPYPQNDPSRAPPPPEHPVAATDGAAEASPRPVTETVRPVPPSRTPPGRHAADSAAPTGTGLDAALADLERASTIGSATGSLRDALGSVDVAASSGGSSASFRLTGPITLPPGGVGLGGGRRGGGGQIEVDGVLGGSRGVGQFDAPRPGRGDRVAGLVRSAGGARVSDPTIDRAAVQRVINAHQHQIVRCYERALLGAPALAGTVQMAWSIAPGGAVASVRIQRSTLASPVVTTCMSTAIRGWRFPAPVGGPVTVTFPWVLRPAGQ